MLVVVACILALSVHVLDMWRSCVLAPDGHTVLVSRRYKGQVS